MTVKEFWSEVGSKKDFSDPFFIDKLKPFVSNNASIFEYGCGYGRILNILYSNGYKNSTGFDLAPKMIARGHATYPHLKLKEIDRSGEIPLPDASQDLAILSTVLVCNPFMADNEKIVQEVARALKQGGLLYFCDFLITPTAKNLTRYREHAEPHHPDYGVYKTSEGTFVRHFRLQALLDLFRGWDLLWLEQIDGATMNNNPVRTVHLIARK